jgi:hypothetical protein
MGDEEKTPKRSGCSMNLFIEACFRFAIYHFDGKITEVLKCSCSRMPNRRGA